MLTFVGWCGEKMSRRTLASLCSVVNVGGEEVLQRRVPVERTHVERQAIRMYQRREETWRPLTRQRVADFIRLIFSAMVYTENAHRRRRQHPLTTKLLKKALVKRVIPFIYRRLVFTMDESMWPITLEEFRELDHFLADHLPRTRRDHPWETVAYFFKEMVQQRREEHKRLEDMEREVMEAVRRCLAT